MSIYVLCPCVYCLTELVHFCFVHGLCLDPAMKEKKEKNINWQPWPWWVWARIIHRKLHSGVPMPPESSLQQKDTKSHAQPQKYRGAQEPIEYMNLDVSLSFSVKKKNTLWAALCPLHLSSIVTPMLFRYCYITTPLLRNAIRLAFKFLSVEIKKAVRWKRKCCSLGTLQAKQ